MKGDKKMSISTDIKATANWGGKFSYNLNAIWNEDNFTSASEEIKKLIAQANQVILSLEKLSEDSDLSSFKGDFVAQIEKTKKEMSDIVESAGNNFLEVALREIAKRVREHVQQVFDTPAEYGNSREENK